jgi:uncharacterized protein
MIERPRSVEVSARDALELATRIERAEAGSGDDMCRLGDLYREGKRGVRRDSRRAFVWYARSALAGDSWGQNNLGACYEHGFGCDQSYARAVKWYQCAVNQGHPTAAMNLAYCRLHGRGVAADKALALELFRYALRGGEERARQEVARLTGEDASPSGTSAPTA